MRAGIVSMMRDPGPVLETFVSYHRSLGFSDFIILFDNPDDPDIPMATSLPGVHVVPVDESVRLAWKSLRYYEQCSAHVDDTVGARQLLNIEYGTRLALELGIEWLLHIDIDELFVLKKTDLAGHIDLLQRTGKDAAAYYNYEAVPSQLQYDNYFRDVGVFKKPPKLLQHQQVDRRSVWPAGRKYFNFYNNGKSMARIAPGVYPLGAHRWTREGEPMQKVAFFNPCILHFAVCGFDVFERKYRHRGNFSDIRIDKDMRANGALLDLDARDAFASGNTAMAKQIYQQRIMMSEDQQQSLIDAGVLARFVLGDKL